MKSIEVKNLEYLILIILFPIFLFSLLTVSKIIFAPNNLLSSNYGVNLKTLTIGKATINVEIADTPEKQSKGLSDRESLAIDRGMLFVFSKSGYPQFWMKGMLFSLDFIWIKGDKVVDITPQVKPEDYQSASNSNRGEPPRMLISKEEVDKVLEINAGMAERLNIKVGDPVRF